MKAANLIWTNALQVKKKLDAVEAKRVKAGQTAAKVEGFRLYKKLKDEVYRARPGGTVLKALSHIARRTKTGKLRKFARKPLAPFGHLVRYKAKKGKDFNVEVGFISPKMSSRGWKKLVTMHQEGSGAFLSGSRKSIGIRLAKVGAKLAKQGRKAEARFFFLKKSTRIGRKSPARPEIDPFWKANRTEAKRNIVRNWERKMAGERI